MVYIWFKCIQLHLFHYIFILIRTEYYSNTTGEVSTDNFYWVNRLIGAMADACDKQSAIHIDVIKEWYNLIHIILFIHMMN